jgi:hypothetical protein
VTFLPYHQRCTRTASYLTPRFARSRFATVLQLLYPRYSTLDHRVNIVRVPASWTGVPDGAPASCTVGRIPTSLPSDPRDAVGRDPQTTRPSTSWLGG